MQVAGAAGVRVPAAGATSGEGEASGFAIRALGRTEYVDCWRAMQAFTAARAADARDEIWLTEHPPVYTLGLAGRRAHVRDTGAVPVVGVDRGGQVTYHGPGQAVAYLLFDLRRARIGVRAMVRAIEAAVVDLLASFGVEAYGRPDAPGVYVRERGVEAKIAAIGLKVRNGCTYHGVALNVEVDLAAFDAIDPCGYAGLQVTSLAALGVTLSTHAAGERLAPLIAARLSRAATR